MFPYQTLLLPLLLLATLTVALALPPVDQPAFLPFGEARVGEGAATFTEDAQGRVYIAVKGLQGALLVCDDTNVTVRDRGDVGGVAVTGQGDVWFTHGSRVISYAAAEPKRLITHSAVYPEIANGTRHVYHDRLGKLMVEDAVMVLAADPFGNLWGLRHTAKQPYLRQIVARLAGQDAGWTVMREQPGFWEQLAVDQTGFIWVAGRAGVIRFDPRKPDAGWVAFPEIAAYPGGEVSALGVARNGKALVARVRGGFYELDILADGTAVAERVTLPGLPEEGVRSFYIDSRGRMWAMANGQLFRSDAPADAWQRTWKPLARLPHGNHDIFGSTLDGKIYFPGGLADYGCPATRQPFDTMAVYDVQADAWSQTPPMSRKRAYCAVAEMGGEIWVIGGAVEKLGQRVPTDSVEIYTPATRTWRPGPTLNIARMEAVVERVGERIYVLCGRGVKEMLTSVVSIGAGEESWREETPAPLPLAQYAGCQLDGKIYVMLGGKGLFAYDVAANQWSSDFPAIPSNKPPRAAAVTAHNGEIWVLGGQDTDNMAGVWRFNPQARAWQAGPDLPYGLAWGAAVSTNNHLYVFGGAAPSKAHGNYAFRDGAFMLR